MCTEYAGFEDTRARVKGNIDKWWTGMAVTRCGEQP